MTLHAGKSWDHDQTIVWVCTRQFLNHHCDTNLSMHCKYYRSLCSGVSGLIFSIQQIKGLMALITVSKPCNYSDMLELNLLPGVNNEFEDDFYEDEEGEYSTTKCSRFVSSFLQNQPYRSFHTKLKKSTTRMGLMIPQAILGCNASSLQGRGASHMLYMVDEGLSPAYIIIGVYSISMSDYCQYSWTPYRASCIAVIQRYYQHSAPPYQGFNTEEHAQTSFAAFQSSGELPAGLFSPTSLRRFDDSPAPSSQPLLPSTPPRRGLMPASLFPVSHIAVNPPFRSTPRSPIRAPQAQSPFTSQMPVYQGRHMRADLGSTSNTIHRNPLSPMPTPLSSIRAPTSVEIQRFYLVIEGEAPGVYGSQYASSF